VSSKSSNAISATATNAAVAAPATLTKSCRATKADWAPRSDSHIAGAESAIAAVSSVSALAAYAISAAARAGAGDIAQHNAISEIQAGGAVQAINICISTLAVSCLTKASGSANATSAACSAFRLTNTNCNSGDAGHINLGVSFAALAADSAAVASTALSGAAYAASALCRVLSYQGILN